MTERSIHQSISVTILCLNRNKMRQRLILASLWVIVKSSGKCNFRVCSLTLARKTCARYDAFMGSVNDSGVVKGER